MAVEALTNQRWSYETNCYVCEPANDGGLQIPFFHDTDTEQVFAEFNLNDTYSGAPSLVHGGVSLAIIDEAMAWAAIAIAGKWAMTIDTHTSFPAPVLVDRPHRVVSTVVGVDGDRIRTEAEIIDDEGAVCTRSTATFVVVSDATVRDRTGRRPPGAEQAFTSDS